MKLLKGIVLLMLPITVIGASCDYIKDNTTGNNKNLTCDSKKTTVTTFKRENETILNNSVCTVKCSEDLAVSFDPVVKVLAGTGFKYPLYVSGERKCTATYKYSDYEKKIKKLVEEYATLSGSAKTTKGNEISNLYEDKKACDGFKDKESDKYNKYTLNANVSISIQKSDSETIEELYVYKDLNDDTFIEPIVEEADYEACDFQESSRTCKGSESTVSGWKSTQRVYGKYTFKDVYLEKYTGEVKTVPIEGKTCNAKDTYYTDFKTITRPNKDINKGYELVLKATNLGNITKSSLTVNCNYEVNNLMYPQRDNLGNCIDENCEKYGSMAYQYRIVDLSDPFPNRTAKANWVGKENLIISTKDNITSMTKFEINLGRSSILKLREYNETHSYDKFDLDSSTNELGFIKDNSNIIKRK